LDPSINLYKPWQRIRRMQALAILLVIVLIYGITILNQLRQDRPYSLDDLIFSTCVIVSPMFVVLLLLLRLLCGERFSNLNLKRARWLQDMLAGIALTILSLGSLYFAGPIVERVLPSAPESNVGGVFAGLAHDPWRLARDRSAIG